MANLGNIVYLTKAQYETLRTDGTITVGDVVYTYNANDLYLIQDENHIYKHNIAMTFSYTYSGNPQTMNVYGYIINNSATAIVKTDLINIFGDKTFTITTTGDTGPYSGILSYKKEQHGATNYAAVVRLAPTANELDSLTVTIIDQDVTDVITTFTDTITQLL